MNPREFCRAQPYDTTIGLTYSFDPLFFERLVLPDLWAGGSGEVFVIADRQELDIAMPRSVGQVQHLGRSYRLYAARTPGHQHAKVLLRVGPAGARLWVGSGNITAGGWGANRELATGWRIEPTNNVGAASVRTLVGAVGELVDGDDSEMLSRVRDIPWIAHVGEMLTADPGVLVSVPSRGSLASQLSRRWRGRRFSRARILTGSTDQAGAFLGWLAQTFGVTEVFVGLDPARSSFDPERLEALAVGVSIVPLPPDPRSLHAKMVFLDGPDGCAALHGSANCSSAAWLLDPKDGGNIEAVVSFDQCTEADFAASLKPFRDSNAHRPREVLERRLAGDQRTTSDLEVVRLVELGVDSDQLTACVEPPVTAPDRVEADFAGLRTQLQAADHEGRRWMGPQPDLPQGLASRFGFLLIHYPDRTIESMIRWLDEHEQLRHAARGRRAASVIPGLAQSLRTTEQRKLLEDLAAIATVLLSDWGGFVDPPPPRVPRPAAEAKTDPVDPDALVRALADIEAPIASGLGATMTPGLPLLGVLRVLFPDPSTTGEGETGEESLTEPDSEPDVPVGQPTRLVRQGAPTESLRERLLDQMAIFLRRLGEPEFARRCTATQLVQATAFPLAVAAKALDGLWIDHEVAASWIVATCDVLLKKEVSSPLPEAGLVRVVRRRYREEGRDETFGKVVSDGALWLALAAALTRVDWRGTSRGLERALALRQVFDEPTLYMTTDVGRLGGLIARLGDTREPVLREFPGAAAAVRHLEAVLAKEFDILRAQQRDGQHLRGDPLWNPNPRAGFARVEEGGPIRGDKSVKVYLHRQGKEVTVLANHYLNIHLAAESSPAVAAALSPLAPCWPGHHV